MQFGNTQGERIEQKEPFPEHLQPEDLLYQKPIFDNWGKEIVGSDWTSAVETSCSLLSGASRGLVLLPACVTSFLLKFPLRDLTF